MLDTYEYYDALPISINDAYGDPFLPEQIDNTIYKINSLSNHQAPIAVVSKAPYNERVFWKLENKLVPNSMLVVFYSLTGLNEGGFSIENRLRAIRALQDVFGEIVIITRPIIQGKNDSNDCLNFLVDVASQTSGLLVLGGLHDSYKMKKISSQTEDMLIDICEKKNVKYFFKSSCCASYIKNIPCWLHDTSEPQNVKAIQKLGYNFEVLSDGVVLDQATAGDLNFLRMVTRSRVYCKKIINNFNVLSISGKRKLECTSSWFIWARSLDRCIGCSYCIINQIEYLDNRAEEIGCHPSEIDYLASINTSIPNTYLSDKLNHDINYRDSNGLISYETLRTVKPCSKKIYQE